MIVVDFAGISGKINHDHGNYAVLLGFHGILRLPGLVAPGRTRPGQLIRELQQRVRRAGDNVGGDVDDSPAAVPGGGPELLKCLPGLDAVALGQHADRLLDPDPRNEGMLQLADGSSEPPGFAGDGGLMA
jgi:hypothetical protein